MKKGKIISLLLVASLIAQPVVPVQANETTITENAIEKVETVDLDKHVNPIFQDLVKKDSLVSLESVERQKYRDAEEMVFETEPVELAKQVRENMLAREEMISLFFATETELVEPEEHVVYIDMFFEEAMIETNDPHAGDYLKWHWGGYSADLIVWEPEVFEGYYFYQYDLAVTYYTNAEQEEMVDEEIDKVIDELDIDSSELDDVEKTKIIYDYICDNVVYDEIHEPDYLTQYTTYGALIDKTAVCQGYSTLMYRLLEEVGVDARVVVSTEEEAHAWNLSEVNGTYYLSDSTWDAGEESYSYFLLGETTFGLQHTPDPVYSAFLDDYRVSSSDYEYEQHDLVKVEKIDATCTEDGIIEYYICETCDEIFGNASGIYPISEEDIKVLAKGHDLKKFDAVKATCTENGTLEYYECKVCGELFSDAQGTVSVTLDQLVDPATGHSITKVEAKDPTCAEEGNIEHYACSGCNKIYTDEAGTNEISKSDVLIDSLSHELVKVEKVDSTCTVKGTEEHYMCINCENLFADEDASTPVLPESLVIQLKNHTYEAVVTRPTKEEQGYTTFTCKVCGDQFEGDYTDPKGEGFGEADVYRIYGEDRYETAFKTAEALKKQLGIEQFESIVIASGTNFADALAGSYFAKQKNAPILLASKKNAEQISAYISDNLVKGGRVYILGGPVAVPETVADSITEYEVERIFGQDRYETNLEILKKAGVSRDNLIICTGQDFADSLSASAIEKPILLVGKKLTKTQKEFLSGYNRDFYIIGGEVAVSDDMFYELAAYGMSERIGGATRYETSVMVAERFFKNPDTAVLAYAMNFPDGLCAGPLAMTKNAPLILTATNSESAAMNYARKENIWVGAVLGGTGLISDDSVLRIFNLESSNDIVIWE